MAAKRAKRRTRTRRYSPPLDCYGIGPLKARQYIGKISFSPEPEMKALGDLGKI
ncbi:MAG: hypothetical protein WC312_03740 [Candidatus Omnitrophota bacterium]|jgi:hypothetical protein